MEDSYIIANFHALCRLCLNKSALSVSIYGAAPDDEANVSLTSKIAECCELQIDPNDGLPGRICYKCLLKVDKCSKFRIQCLQNDNKLRQITNRVNDLDNSNSSELSNYNYNNCHEQQKPKPEDYIVEDSVVMVVDPSLDYDSSEESEGVEQVEPDVTERDNNPEQETITESFFKNVSMCQYCDQAFVSPEKCKEHEIAYHDPNLPYKCVECRDLARHVLVHSGMKPYRCRKCPLTFGRRDKLIKHEVKHGPVTPEHNTDYDNNQDMHDMVVNVNPFSNLMTSPNQLHTDGSNTDYDLPRVPDHISGESSFSRVQKNPSTSKQQNSPPKKQTLAKNRPKNIKCHQCPKRFSSLDAYKTHVSIAHIGSRVFQCKICFKKFARKRELDRHTPIHSGMKPFSCGQCDKKFTRKDKLNKHEQSHECLVVNMPCIECGATFEKKADLVAHIKSHFTDNFDDKITQIKKEDEPEFQLDDNFYDLET
ncbi:putative zinc finger protein [Operophtera brumata]|uniref:Putative zinc finger protein n=1 Tax=Operophtera brumata TaxID=104452 RepID=A0A0L7L890_OPEBR|nr:putative zinc finger protein [Operophtera brumata]